MDSSAGLLLYRATLKEHFTLTCVYVLMNKWLALKTTTLLVNIKKIEVCMQGSLLNCVVAAHHTMIG